MPDAGETAHNASVVSLRIADFAAKPVAAQLELRSRVTSLLADALAAVPPADRLVLDAGDGEAVVFLGPPDGALEVARACDASVRSAGLPVRIGLNAGPVKLADGPDGSVSIFGDGVASAEAAAGFAGPGRMVATAAFRDAVARGFPEWASAFTALGERTDGRLRAYQLFECPPTPAPRDPSRRNVLRAVALGVGVAIMGGLVVRGVRKRIDAQHRPAVVTLDISPAADVVVDGAHRGRTPPMRTLELAPGRHTVEIRHATLKPITLEIDLKPGEQTTVRHAFGSPPQPSAWKNFLRKLGP